MRLYVSEAFISHTGTTRCPRARACVCVCLRVCVCVAALLSYALPLLSLHATALIKYLPPILWRGRIVNCFWYYDDRRPHFSRGGLYSSFFFFFTPVSLFNSHQTNTGGEGEGGGMVALLPECVVSYISPLHTQA